VLPYVWYQRRHRADAGQLAAAKVEAKEEAQAYVVVLNGAWTRSNIDIVRRCFNQAVQPRKNVRLDLGGVTHVDSAFVGLVMLLQGYQQQHGRRLDIFAVPRTVRRVVEYCCAEYLCPQAPSDAIAAGKH
jgi:ABC-type transporter Mla MlaB component